MDTPTITKFDTKATLGGRPSTLYMLFANLESAPGQSFLTGYDELKRTAFQLDLAELKVYLFLAGCRNYVKFLYTGDLGLSVDLVPFSMKAIELNSLLTLRKQTVFFRFEEERT